MKGVYNKYHLQILISLSFSFLCVDGTGAAKAAPVSHSKTNIIAAMLLHPSKRLVWY